MSELFNRGNNGKETGKKWSVVMTESVMHREPLFNKKWAYDDGVILKGVEKVWCATGKKEYFDYIKKNIDNLVDDNGQIYGYHQDVYNIDHLNNGKVLLFLYNETKEEKYKKAADSLWEQMKTHPRIKEGGFWHKKIYENQMWLDGLYMGAPFLIQYAAMFGEESAFDDLAYQYIIMYNRSLDKKTGLLYHGYDESRKMDWADKETGCSPNFWGRSIGWYVMGLVDALDYLPENLAKRAELIEILNKVFEAVVKYQHKETGLWYQVIDMTERVGNFQEGSVSAMLTYAMAKAVNKGYSDKKYMEIAKKCYDGIIAELIDVNEEGYTSMRNVCAVAGLGGTPYRDGSYQYYIGEQIKLNDHKGVGSWIQAAAEFEL
jgi:unsaturated rhamnogalacturonyl hydrolase